MMSDNQVSRRNFLRLSGLAGTALCLGFYFPSRAEEAEVLNAAGLLNEDVELNAWIHIDTNGKVTLFNHRAEMGQGSYQSVPQIIAEELEVNLADVNIVFAQGNREKYGNQITGGSSTIRSGYKNLLKLGATARVMLIAVAAKKWGTSIDECYAEAGHVLHKSTGKKFHYGELVLDAAKMESPKDVVLKKISD